MSISDEKRSKTKVLRPRNIPGETSDMSDSEPEKKREEIYIYIVEPNWMRLRVGYRRWAGPLKLGGGAVSYMCLYSKLVEKFSCGVHFIVYCAPPFESLKNVPEIGIGWFRFYSEPVLS